jgi:ribose transport system permease protein
MGLVVSGSLLVYSLTVNHEGPPNVPDIVREFGGGKLLGLIPISAILWGAIATAVIVGLRYTGLGRLIYAVGDNPVAVRLAGVRGWLVLLATYVICGFLAGLAGLVLEGAINGVDLSLGDVFLLPSVAAVVIGGTSIYGGHGGYAGSLVGALILTVLSSLFTLLDAPDPLKQILYGAIVVLLAALYARTTGDNG